MLKQSVSEPYDPQNKIITNIFCSNQLIRKRVDEIILIYYFIL